jgi:hypothetical protein
MFDQLFTWTGLSTLYSSDPEWVHRRTDKLKNNFGIKKMALLTGCKTRDQNTLLGKNVLHCCLQYLLLADMLLSICT